MSIEPHHTPAPGLDFGLLGAALEAMGEGITLTDATGRIVYSNPAAERILGVVATDAPPDEWAKHYGVFVPDTEEPFPAEQYPLVRALGGEQTNFVEMLIRNTANPNGAIISVTGRPVRDTEGRVTGAAAVFRDISIRRKAEKELQASLEDLQEMQRQKGELLGFLVHDMKGPLTAILAGAELILMGEGLSGEDRDGLREVMASTRTLHRMVLNLLDIQAAEDGRLEPDYGTFQLLPALEGIAATAEARGAKMTVVAPGIPDLVADPELIRRVVGNLVDNCLKYGPDGGRIWLDARLLSERRVLLCVRDEGPGVPPELRDRIFDKYARLERDQHSRRAGSRGLGLRFCKIAVEAHGGRIWVEDNEPQGACFAIDLPVESGQN